MNEGYKQEWKSDWQQNTHLTHYSADKQIDEAQNNGLK